MLRMIKNNAESSEYGHILNPVYFLFCSSDGLTPLMIASCSGDAGEEEEGEEGVIANFLWHGADPHQRTERAGETALHLAARYARSDAAKRLLESGADANAQDHAGRTPLHAAVAADAQGVFQVHTP